jgi:hypothetical protein
VRNVGEGWAKIPKKAKKKGAKADGGSIAAIGTNANFSVLDQL